MDAICEEDIENQQKIQAAPILTAILTHFGYGLLYFMGHFREILVYLGIISDKSVQDIVDKGFKPLFMGFESFYFRNLYGRGLDLFNRPICTNAGASITILDRERKNVFDPMVLNGKKIKAINMGSYNYLGFGDPEDICLSYTSKMLKKYGIVSCSSYNYFGFLKIHRKLETMIANFLGKEDAICFSMGFATNSSNIQSFCSDRCCIVSDELNHASIILGSRLSNCKIYIYKHNDMKDLESILRDILIQGRGKDHEPWDKIILICEGIYSMEGTFVNLPAILRLKEKYKFYIYLDEAHSIGCIGPTGRGVTEFFKIDRKNIDVMMGTFTKSFGSNGGYIAADKKTIDFIRNQSWITRNCITMSPVVCAQIIVSLKIITGEIGGNLGVEKLKKLKENVLYMRKKIKDLGFIIYGHDASPIIPILLYIPGKVREFSRLMLQKNIAICIVGFPVTSMTSTRARFCISSNHTKEMLDHVVESLDEIGSRIGVKFNKSILGY